jgi:flagellar hook-associated protein 3 FlgL
MRYQNFLSQIGLAQQRYLKAQEKVATGKKVNSPSDDPAAASDILRINSEGQVDDQYLRNLTFAKSKLQLTDGVLDSVEQLVERAVQLGQLSFSDPSSSQPNVTELQSLDDQMVTAANTTYAGRFIFGGSVTTQTPYTKDPLTGAVTYNGNSEDMPLQISNSVAVPTQIPGSDLFSGSINIFDAISNLATAIQNGDKDGIDAQIKNLQQFSDNVSVSRTKLATYLNLTSTGESDLSLAKISRETQLTNVEAADMAAALSELTAAQNGLQATLAAGSKVSQLTVLDYLR